MSFTYQYADADAREAVRAAVRRAEEAGEDVVGVLDNAGWLATPTRCAQIEHDLLDDLIGMVENLPTPMLLGYDIPQGYARAALGNFAQFLRNERDRKIQPNG